MVDEENLPLDFSITKFVVGLLASALIGLWLFISLARSYKKTGISHPKGIQSFLEPAVLFVRDDIAIPNIGEEKYEKYMPYLLSVFFFILINNIMGLDPFPATFWSKCYREYCTYLCSCCMYILNYTVQRQQNLLETYFCSSRGTILAAAGYDTSGNYRDYFKTVCTDDSFVCKYNSRPYYCFEPFMSDFYL